MVSDLPQVKNWKACLLTVQDYHKGIKITSRSTGIVSGVKRKAPEEGHIILGFQISGDGKYCLKESNDRNIYFVRRSD
jgi:hypothetical protein